MHLVRTNQSMYFREMNETPVSYHRNWVENKMDMMLPNSMYCEQRVLDDERSSHKFTADVTTDVLVFNKNAIQAEEHGHVFCTRL